MKKIYSIFTSAIVLLVALQGCNKTYLKEVVDESKKQNQEVPVIEDDEITKVLRGIKGVSNVTISLAALPQAQTKAEDVHAGYVKQYFFSYAQPVDHNDPAKGTFYQRVAMQLTDLKNPVVVGTLGYALTMTGQNSFQEDLVTFLNANYVEIEFRYFGDSQPEDMNNVNFTYLYSEQSACDIHEVVTMLKANLFKQNKWVATGASKGGITAALHAYYADQKGWKDFDLYVPFCAPFLAGTTDTPLDSSMGKYVFESCGAGYPAGSKEAVGYANLRKILLQCESKPALRDAVLCRYHSASMEHYRSIMTQFKGATEAHMLSGFYVDYMETLIDRFIYTPFSQWAQMVPDPDSIKEGDKPGVTILMSPLDQVLHFLFMSEEEFNALVKEAQEEEEGDDTKASTHTVQEMQALRIDPKMDMAYGVATVRELGTVGVDFSWLPEKAFFTQALGYEVEEKAVGRARSWDYYEGQWDGGKLMTDLRNWLSSGKQKMVFVYGTNDPWTGGAIPDAAAQANPNVVKVMNFGGWHDNAFLHENNYTKEASTQIQNAVKDFLNK